MGYFNNLEGTHGYLVSAPTKKGCLDNANHEGNITILPNSNNRALVIDTGDSVILQSYDTDIIKIDKTTGNIIKLWSGYSITTLKHINEFMRSYNGMTFNKKQWLEF